MAGVVIGARGSVAICSDPTDRRRRGRRTHGDRQADDGCAVATAADITAATLEPFTAKEARTLVRLLESLR
jgi:hypothetical protein